MTTTSIKKKVMVYQEVYTKTHCDYCGKLLLSPSKSKIVESWSDSDGDEIIEEYDICDDCVRKYLPHRKNIPENKVIEDGSK